MKTRYADAILRYLAIHGSITHGSAERLLHVSPVTVRRIFRELAEDRRALRAHGELRAFAGVSDGTVPVLQREYRQAEEKEILAQRALGYLDPNRLNMIHGGTTTQYLAEYITAGSYLTDSVSFAEALNRRFPAGNGPNLAVTGGILNMKAGFLYGPKAQAVVRSYAAAVFLTSVRGLDREGLLETDEHTVGIMRSMMAASGKTIVLADHRKFDTAGNCRLAAWSEIDLLITFDAPENAGMIRELLAAGVKIDLIPLEPKKKGVGEA